MDKKIERTQVSPFDLALEVVTSANDGLQQLLQILLSYYIRYTISGILAIYQPCKWDSTNAHGPHGHCRPSQGAKQCRILRQGPGSV